MSKREAYEFPEVAPGAPVIWKSLEEREAPEAARAAAAAEFPHGFDDEKLSVSRRGFMTLAGAIAAAAGLEGCIRRPVENILPYSQAPEYLVPGVPLHYATAMQQRGDAIGLIVEAHEGRPTKIEGNPEHPANNPAGAGGARGPRHGGTTLLAQASILDLYDPDRSDGPRRRKGALEGEGLWTGKANEAPAAAAEPHAAEGGEGAAAPPAASPHAAAPHAAAPVVVETGTHVRATFADVDAFLSQKRAELERDGGAKLRILAQSQSSPTFLRMREALRAKLPRAKLYTWAPVSDSNAREGARIAFGQPVVAQHNLALAKVIVSLDSDFLSNESGSVRASRLFAKGREPGREMNRLYVVEPSLTSTGANADHRLRLPARDIQRYALALAKTLASSHGIDFGPSAATIQATDTSGIPARWLEAVAKELAGARGRSVVIVGARQPASLHALAHAINLALGNIGRTVQLFPVADPEERDTLADIRALAEEMDGGAVETLVILGGNPVYDAPADLDFKAKLAKVGTSIHLSSHFDETSHNVALHLPRAHELETWGDLRSIGGMLSIQQPMIAPLFGGRSDIELLALLAGEANWRGHELVRATMRAASPALSSFERTWRRALHRGVVEGSEHLPMDALTFRAPEIAQSLAASRQAGAALGANNLEVTFAPDVKLYDGRHANNSWMLELPDPMTRITWDNVALFSPKTARELGIRSGDMINLSGPNSAIVDICAWILPGQCDNSVALTLGWGRPEAGRWGSNVGFNTYSARTTAALHFGEGFKVTKRGGTHDISQTQEHHSMEGRPIALDLTMQQYADAQSAGPPSHGAPAHGATGHGDRAKDARRRLPLYDSVVPTTSPLWNQVEYEGFKWGMSIDLNSCFGCNACVIACQSENNIPVVGKEMVARGREMHWIRIDRYFLEDPERKSTIDDPEVAFQPVACVQCEEAPCENVCPVTATAHSPEGLNDMAYNRCIGTRYCANNCPYKVRRFNYFNWHGEVPETKRMQFNPNVTVRFRGVMEKCSYCVQRIQEVKIGARNANAPVRDGDITPACAQACPSQAIVFGDLNNQESRVAKLAGSDRGYKLLGEIGTQPRTTYLAKIRNPNREMLA